MQPPPLRLLSRLKDAAAQSGSYLWAFLHAIGWNIINIAIMSGLVLCRRRAKGAGAAVAAPDVEAKP